MQRFTKCLEGCDIGRPFYAEQQSDPVVGCDPQRISDDAENISTGLNGWSLGSSIPGNKANAVTW
ncbi:hypothetical protein [Yersinia alsatica]|uniref:hypothetical protein n=1 Tax=Yersinia alsatica TaxID=2890317 RepID=UPI0016437974|nr:hypothetical protein [Yersinia alsatica]